MCGCSSSRYEVPSKPAPPPTPSSDHGRAAEGGTKGTEPEDKRAAGAEKQDLKRLPHNCEVILRDADSPVDMTVIDRLYDQLYDGVFLNQGRKRFWIDKKTNSNCFMVFPRNLRIIWGEDRRYWRWTSVKEPSILKRSETTVDVAELISVCWLEVSGKLDMAKLTPGVLYEVAFVIRLRDPYGWGYYPVNFKLTVPDGTEQKNKEKLNEKPTGQWLEILVGEFRPSSETAGEIEFSMCEIEGGNWKSGLEVKGVVIRPKG